MQLKAEDILEELSRRFPKELEIVIQAMTIRHLEEQLNGEENGED